jgi:hypothetical protein
VIAIARFLAGVLLAVVTVALAACGDESPPPPSSPAALVPASAPIYVEATVRPASDEREAVERWLARFPGGDRLLDRLVDEVDRSLAGGKDDGDAFTYTDDVEPWLGSRIGFFFAGSGASPPAAGVFPVGDPDAAAQVAREQPAKGGGRTAAIHLYRGVLYTVDRHGQTAVYVDGFLIAGDEQAVRAAIDVERGDRPSLEASGALDSVRGDAGAGQPLVLARIELGALANAVALPREGLPASAIGTQSGTGRLATFTQATAGGRLGGTLTAALAVRDEALTLEAVTHLGSGLAQTSLDQDAGNPLRVLGKLPAGSVIAAAVPSFGAQAAMGLEQGLGAQAGPFTDPRALREGLRQQLGFDPVALFRSVGDLGFFVSAPRGAAGGAGVLSVERRRPVVKALEALPLVLGAQPDLRLAPLPGGLGPHARGLLVNAPRTPAPFAVVLSGDRLVLAYGLAAAREALTPSTTLASGPQLRAASDALGPGFRPSVLVDMPGLVRALEGLGRGSERGLTDVEPYLRPLGLVVVGSRTAGTSVETRVVATARR